MMFSRLEMSGSWNHGSGVLDSTTWNSSTATTARPRPMRTRCFFRFSSNALSLSSSLHPGALPRPCRGSTRSAPRPDAPHPRSKSRTPARHTDIRPRKRRRPPVPYPVRLLPHLFLEEKLHLHAGELDDVVVIERVRLGV